MDGIVEDDKKTFDAENAQDDDAQPDPDEHLMLDQGNGRVWLVKVRTTPPPIQLRTGARSVYLLRFPSSSWNAGQR